MTQPVSMNNLGRAASEQNLQKEPIAIIGIGCRFPGNVNTPEKFWSLVSNGVNAITEIPSDRIDINAYYDPRPATPGKMMTRWGGFLGNIDQFDADFFGISPREADRLDPQQRLLLEVAWNALEDGGQVPEKLFKSQTGVFVGLWLNDYEARMFVDPSAIDFYMTTGSGRYSASGRLSYFFGFQGPSITIDTACSSSLVAVNLACQSLWNNQCSLALAGGANVILQPHVSIAYSQSKMMASDGRCKFGDAQADGYVRSEGAGIVVLKKLSQAIAEHDPIYAVIKGGSVNNDGAGSGFLATPSQEGQEAMLRAAYHDANVDPTQVQYVEAHGTGTKTGDPIELRAIGEILGRDRSDHDKLFVGSVKTNFGHTEGAAGIAGLIKVALSLKNGAIPPSLHLNELNPDIAWQELHLTIPRTLIKFSAEEDVIAGISAFGITGTNAHIVLAKAPRDGSVVSTQSSNQPYFLPISAHTPEALKTLVNSYLAVLRDENAAPLSDICFTAGLHRTHHIERLALTGNSNQEFQEQLSAHLQQNGSSVPNKVDEHARLVFVFPGQGSQWFGMGRDLFAKNEVFRGVMIQCDQAIQRWADWSLLEQLSLQEDSPLYRLNEINVIQPVLFAIEVALASVWKLWGIEPTAVIGHSMGEVSAAYVAGALDLDDAARIICKRSQLMQRTSGQGEMAVVGLSFIDSESALGEYKDKLSVAVHNGPHSTVISGDPDVLASVLHKLESQGIFCRKVNVDVASHSPQMDPLRIELIKSLEGIHPRPASVPIYSTVTEEISDGTNLDEQYWGNNLRWPVHFHTMIQRLLRDGCTIFIEMSPHPLLLNPIQETAYDENIKALSIASIRKNTVESIEIFHSLGMLYEAGYAIPWEKLYPTGKIVKLPTYPWQRQHFWYAPTDIKTVSSGIGGKVEHPLLGIRLPILAQVPGYSVWQNEFARLLPSLPIGCVEIPESLYREIAFTAVDAISGNKNHTLLDFVIHESLPANSDLNRIIQTSLVQNDATLSIQIFSRKDDETEWVKHATGMIRAGVVEAKWFYELEWDDCELNSTDPKSKLAKPANWLILADLQGIGEKLSLILKENDVHFKEIRFSETIDYDKLLASEPFTQIVFLWGVDAPFNEQITPEMLAQSQILGSEALLALLQAIVRQGSTNKPKVWSITRGAQSVLENEEPQMCQATLWGLARVASLELPGVWKGIVDLAKNEDTNQSVDLLWNEILNSDEEDQVAYRNGKRYVPRLLPKKRSEIVTKQLFVSTDGAYLITGGMGRLGLELSKWLASLGARHLVLTSRSQLPDRARWDALDPISKWGQRISVIRTLENIGVQVTVAQADAANHASMQALFHQFGESLPSLKGVIHAAGITTHQTITDIDINSWRSILSSKVQGGWILHELTKNIPLDFFVSFSSAASVWGSQGMSHYAAANHFLDQLAWFRKVHQLSALTVNWGWWDEGGIASKEQEDLFARVGLKAMSADEALHALSYLIEIGSGQCVVADVDWAIFKPIYEAARTRRLIRHIEVQKTKEPIVSPSKPENTSILQQLQGLSPEKQEEFLLERIRELVAGILGFGTSRSINIKQGFFKMGMDSLMTVQLRTQLEANFDCQLPPTIAFEYPTITELCNYLLHSFGQTPSEAAPAIDPIRSSQTDNDQTMDTLSERELLSLLDNELAKVDKLITDGKSYE